MDKPDGLYLITPEQGENFAAQLPVQKFHGIGKATFKKMQALGLQNGADLKACSLIFLQQHFGKAGLHYYNISRGIDLRPVISQRVAQSIGVETTFAQDMMDFSHIQTQLLQLLREALVKAHQKKLTARTLTIKIKYHNFVQITRSQTVTHSLLISTESHLLALLTALLKNTEVGKCKVRLVGVSLSSLQTQMALATYQQMDLFYQSV